MTIPCALLSVVASIYLFVIYKCIVFKIILVAVYQHKAEYLFYFDRRVATNVFCLQYFQPFGKYTIRYLKSYILLLDLIQFFNKLLLLLFYLLPGIYNYIFSDYFRVVLCIVWSISFRSNSIFFSKIQVQSWFKLF